MERQITKKKEERPTGTTRQTECVTVRCAASSEEVMVRARASAERHGAVRSFIGGHVSQQNGEKKREKIYVFFFR